MVRPTGFFSAAFIGICMVFMVVQQSAAHPHVFIEQKTTLVFNDKGLSGFKIHWVFDEMFSAMIGADFDKNKNGVLEKDEIAVIKEKAFGYIASFNYYIQIKIDGNPFEVKFVKDFNAALKDGKLIYDFFIPCHVTAIKTPKKIMLSPYDPEYYSDIYFPEKEHLFVDGAQAFVVEKKVARDKSTLFYFETVNPMAIFFNFRLK